MATSDSTGSTPIAVVSDHRLPKQWYEEVSKIGCRLVRCCREVSPVEHGAAPEPAITLVTS